MNIEDYWNLDFPPRQTQTNAFNFFLENQDKKYFFIITPVGTGKSAIGVAIADYLDKNNKSSYILTPQKILQEQYERSFNTNDEYLASLYGKNHYKCTQLNSDCEAVSVMRIKCKNCPYRIASDNAKQSRHAVFNYALALKLFSNGDQWTSRNVLIMDECHQLENILTEHEVLDITKEFCINNNIPLCKSNNVSQIYEYLRDIFAPNVKDIYNELEERLRPFIGNSKLSTAPFAELKFYNELGIMQCILDMFLSFDPNDVEDAFVNVSDENGIKFKHIFGARVFNDYLKTKADKFVFLSATVYDYKEYCNNLNIPLDQVAFFECDSDFPAENRPVVFIPSMKMSYGWDNDTNIKNRKQMIENIKQLLLDHKDEKGIIHAGNYQISKWLVNELKSINHVVYHHNPDSGDSRDKIIDAFIKSIKPAILISPSITEGLDLIEDKSRFAIFVKIAYGSLGDKWIKKRMDMSNNWYLLRALTDVMQGCGRVVRSKDDYGVSYILDSSWNYLFSKMKHRIPKWWLDAYHEV
jgi:ATP-dependent DNA helicase DinG